MLFQRRTVLKIIQALRHLYAEGVRFGSLGFAAQQLPTNKIGYREAVTQSTDWAFRSDPAMNVITSW
ncbi:MAG: hypothetical protein SGJ20_14355 [Planctomycetota bacterium]|nr:hypothetical protein [Planctomycetota bacterium]